MAFNGANLVLKDRKSRLGGPNSGLDESLYVWSYTTTDNLATATGGDYWDGAVERVRNGDMVAIEASDGDHVAMFLVGGSVSSPDINLFRVADYTTQYLFA